MQGGPGGAVFLCHIGAGNIFGGEVIPRCESAQVILGDNSRASRARACQRLGWMEDMPGNLYALRECGNPGK